MSRKRWSWQREMRNILSAPFNPICSYSILMVLFILHFVIYQVISSIYHAISSVYYNFPCHIKNLPCPYSLPILQSGGNGPTGGYIKCNRKGGV